MGIQVFVRIRGDSIDGNLFSDDNQILLKNKNKQFRFDKVFNQNASQELVYNQTAKPLLDNVLDGYNATIFAYGATGCGKTYTILGNEENPGIISRTMDDLFNLIKERKDEDEISIKLSFLEVYNEKIRDLFNSNNKKTLSLREDDSRMVVAGLSMQSPTSRNQVLNLMMKGNENRTKAFTAANSVSSRSHAILQIHISQQPLNANLTTNSKMKKATLSIIDLAGSERASATQNQGKRLHEGANINRSLLALGNCINALCNPEKVHIPYRDSKLTRLLKYSLSGNCKVVMIAAVSTFLIQTEETCNTLKYANRAKEIRTSLKQNVFDIGVNFADYPKLVSKLRSEIAVLKASSNPNREMDEDAKEEIQDILKSVRHKANVAMRKLLQKQIDIDEMEQAVRLNLDKIDILTGVLSAFSLSVPLNQQEMLNDVYVDLNDTIDRLEGSNTLLHSNINNAEKAQERHHKVIQKLLQEHLSEWYKIRCENMLNKIKTHLTDTEFKPKKEQQNGNTALTTVTLQLLQLMLQTHQKPLGTTAAFFSNVKKMIRQLSELIIQDKEADQQIDYDTTDVSDAEDVKPDLSITGDEGFEDKVQQLENEYGDLKTPKKRLIADLDRTPMAMKRRPIPLAKPEALHERNPIRLDE